MKKLDRIIGFISFNNADFPFEFNEKTFSVLLFPPTKAIWEEYTDPVKILDSLLQDKKTHEWIPQRELEGLTSAGYHIIFNVQDVLDNDHGFISFKVNWYMYHSDSLHADKIDGLRILGPVVNLFYPPKVALESKIDFSKDGKSIEKMSVNSTKPQTRTCGKYRVCKNTDAKIDVLAYASFHSGLLTKSIDAISNMMITFSTPVGFNTVIKAYYHLQHFFEYITYRKNVDLGDVDLFFNNKEGKRDYSGVIVFPYNCAKETHKKRDNRIISYSLLNNRSSKILTAIKNNVFDFQHICHSIDDMSRYPASRIIMIFAAFEREYRNIYGQDSERSQEYLEVKKQVISLVDDYFKKNTGKKRECVKEFKNHIKNKGSGFAANIKTALIDCKSVMTPFVARKYSAGSYLDTVHDISGRMGKVRNGIAHSRLDLHFDPIHLSDIKVVEELIYAMRLRKISMGALECKKAINQLFGEHLSL